MKMAEPTIKTIKRLFALSKNRCAFTGCKEHLVHDTGTVIADIAHIKGQSPGGPRYDSSQSDLERHSFENLMLLCRNHHRVIDDEANLGMFTVDALVALKQAHELAPGASFEVSEETAKNVIQNATHYNFGSHSVVSIGQMGGQTAHSITNIGPQPRVLSNAAKQQLAIDLRTFSPQEIDIAAIDGDAESLNLARQIATAFADAGWPYSPIAAIKFYIPPEWNANPNLDRTKDITVVSPQLTPEARAILGWILSVNLHGKGHIESNPAQRLQIVVGSNT